MNIQSKILAIQNEIQKIYKEKIIKFQNYRYFTETQILDEIKPLLNKYNLLVTISDENQDLIYERPNSDNKEYLVKYLKKVEI